MTKYFKWSPKETSPVELRRKLFILAEDRSGSTWLNATLNQNPEIFMARELLTQTGRREEMISLRDFDLWLHYYLRRKMDFKSARGLSVREVNRLIEHPDQPRYTGFKAVYKQFLTGFDWMKFIHHHKDAHFIILERKDFFASTLSALIADLTKVWHSQPSQVFRFRIPPDKLVRNFRERLMYRRMMEDLLGAFPGLSYQRIYYEDLFAPETLIGLQEQLGLKNPLLPAHFRKVTSDQRILKEVENLPEILNLREDLIQKVAVNFGYSPEDLLGLEKQMNPLYSRLLQQL